ncbi:MAG: pre-mRNA cleavage and polyadenylation factor (CPF) complex subunit [Chrysothrix sp. TS-e1954]|nr:MAG: pre-mRNA cleavage and polyadenylation factor (CPF) complex subunit [Chrysothrix sp. TS-e1954]
MIPPIARKGNPGDTVPAKHLHTSTNKIKHPVNVVKWTPEGRRLLTGSSSGEFTLWNGMGFNFETIMAAHDSAIRAVAWSHSDDWLVSTDQGGIIKYWQPTFNNVKEFKGHDHPIRDVAFAPTDTKFVTASDDSTLKIWDFAGGAEVSTLTGHGWDVKTVDWHPTKGLLVSGSKDHQIKLWDPRNGRCLTTLHGHKTSVSKAAFEPSKGLLLATCARDQVARIFDIRMMRDIMLLKGHKSDVMTLCWHPFHPSLLSTGEYGGGLNHYLLDEAHAPPEAGPSANLSPYDYPDPPSAPTQTLYPAHALPYAHEAAIWSMDWHPLGHIMASGSNDRFTRFWTRPRPGDTHYINDKYHMGEAAEQPSWRGTKNAQARRDEEEMEADDEADGLVDQKMPAQQSALPGLPGINAGMPSDMMNGNTHAQQPASSDMPVPPSLQNGHMPLPPMPGMDPNNMPPLSKLSEMFGGNLPPPPAPGQNGQFPPPPPGFPGFANGQMPPPGMLPPGFPPMPGFGQQAQTDASVRRRGPLPSQQDSLKEEMKRGNYTRAR